METQAAAAHYGLTASPHGLFHQLWQHRHSSSQTVPSSAGDAPRSGLADTFMSILCLTHMIIHRLVLCVYTV